MRRSSGERWLKLRRPRVELEERLVSEWVAVTYPRARYRLRTRLGPLPELTPELEALGVSRNIYTVVRHWADCLVFLEDKTIIVEGKIRWKPEGLGQLITYRSMFYQTPEYGDRWALPVELVALFAYVTEDNMALLQQFKISPVEYRPKWISEAYIERMRRTY